MWLFSSKSGSIRVNLVVIGHIGCILAKVVVFGLEVLYLGKLVYLNNSGCFRVKNGCIWAKWLYSGKHCCIRAK